MSPEKGRSTIRLGALALGAAVFFGALYWIYMGTTLETVRRLGVALPFALLFSGLSQLTRTWAWACCFPQRRQVGFLRLARVRLAAEAFSYLTFGAMAGEPLKVVLLSGAVDARQATATVALERLAYLVGTTVLVGIGAILAIVGQPLTHLWARVFGALAIGAAVVTAATIAAVLGRGTYVQSLLARIDDALGTTLGESRGGRFTAAVERQMLDLVRGNPTRLLALMTAAAVSSMLMALEAWVIVWVARAPITLNGAVAIETFSRVASFASAFIPANLGALEASSLAAAAAVGAVGGGAALALARRLRGLFWAGVGLAIYPHGLRPPVDRAAADAAKGGRQATLFYLPTSPSVPVPPTATLAGLPIAERIVRAAIRAGYSRIVVWAPETAWPARMTPRLRSLADGTSSRVDVATTQADWDDTVHAIDPLDSVTVVGAGTMVSPALLARAREMSAAPGRSLDVAAGPAWPESGVIRMSAGDALDHEHVAGELAARRAHALPLPSGVDVANGLGMLAIRITDPAQLGAADATMRRASYKDTDAKLARFNRRISLPISVALMRTPLTANQLSVMLVAIGFYSAWLFSLGHYWTSVLAAFLSLAASVLDGCDGEIARLKYQESALGCWIETFGDYSYYLAIFAGMTIGAVRQTHWDVFYWFGGVALAGTLLSFAILIFLRSRITNGRPEKLHAVARARFKSEPTFWSRMVWRVSFVATRAAMPYGIMAFALVHALPGIVVLGALGSNVYWISLMLKMRHLLGGYRTVGASWIGEGEGVQ